MKRKLVLFDLQDYFYAFVNIYNRIWESLVRQQLAESGGNPLIVGYQARWLACGYILVAPIMKD